MADIVMTIIKTLSLVLNAVVLTICLPRKRALPIVITGWAAFGAISYIMERLSGALPEFTIVGSVLFVPLVLWAYSGRIFQMLYAMILPMFFTASQQMFIESFLRLLMPFGTDAYWLAYLIAVLVISTVYIYLVFRFGKRLLERLFVQWQGTEWALYTFGAMLSLCVLIFLYQSFISSNTIAFLLALCSIAWSYIMLCFAIINTHEKLQAQYERDLSREIISSGRGYYDKLTDMTERLHILRHDYKHHLASMQKMLNSGYENEIRDYLEILNTGIDDKGINDYCKSRVLNALLDSFSERCEKENIEFSVKIILPPDTIDNYELCVIVGNLLENAITACGRTPKEKRRYIELSMRPREEQYGIKAENSYDGVLWHDGKTLYSTKDGGGLGISSIKTVAARHNGEYVPVWDEQRFSAFVVLKLEDN